MPIIDKISLLPKPVLDTLVERLRHQGYGDLIETSRWLKALGHDIGHSTVGRFAQRLKQQDRASSAAQDPAAVQTIDVRLRCADIAAKAGATDDGIIALASKLERWAREGN